MRPTWMTALIVTAVGGGATSLAAVAGAAPAYAAPTYAAPTDVAQTVTIASPTRPLRVRTGPATWHPAVRSLPNGASVVALCQVSGQRIDIGTVRRTNAWNRLADGTFISDAYVSRAATPPPCSGPAPAPAPAPAAGLWVHPLPGFRAAPHSFRPPHIGVDLMAFNGTPVHSAAAGQVIEVVCNIQPGASCDRPGNRRTRGCGWYVKVAHPGGVTTLYCHLLRLPVVTVGQLVGAGQVLGVVGSSGNSSYPHLHFEVHTGGLPTRLGNAVDPAVYMRQVGVPISR